MTRGLWLLALLALGCDDDGATPTHAGDAAPTADATPIADASPMLDAAPAVDAQPSLDAEPEPTPDAGHEGCHALVEVDGLTVFQFEASRPDATDETAGEAAPGAGACSVAGVLPWTGVTRLEAEAACAAAGFHLCTDAEWTLLCAGPEGYPYPYGEVHEPGRCNDHVGGLGALQPTGAKPECETPYGVADVSGNVWELNADGFRRGASWKVNAVLFHKEVAGCVEKFNVTDQYYDDDLGFRCCR